MELFDEFLKVKTSTLPKCGKGLFTKVLIPKGSLITEYKGKVSTWKDVDHADGNNLYIFSVSKNHVIDANGNTSDFAHFANDANGLTKLPGVKNNAQYVVKKKRVFIEAMKNIPAGSEVFVGYGKDYWAVIKKNGIL